MTVGIKKILIAFVIVVGISAQWSNDCSVSDDKRILIDFQTADETVPLITGTVGLIVVQIRQALEYLDVSVGIWTEHGFDGRQTVC